MMRTEMRFGFLLLAFLGSCVMAASAQDAFSPKFQEVPLTEYTALTLDVVPDLGTRLIFPFILTDEAHYPSFSAKITNTNLFFVPSEEEYQGQNIYTINAGVPQTDQMQLAQLFLSVDGYNISITLRSTMDLTKHQSDIVFTLTEKERQDLIERAIQKRLENMKASYAEKMGEVDDLAETRALKYVGFVALTEPKITPVKERFKLALPDGEKLRAYLEDIKSFEDKYFVMALKLENRSPKDIQIESITLEAENGERVKTINVFSSCEEPLVADSEIQCSITTQDPLLADARKITIHLNTDRGSAHIEW